MKDELLELAKKYKFPKDKLHILICPEVGEEFIVRGIVYKTVYAKSNPLSFTATPVRLAKPREEAQTWKEKFQTFTKILLKKPKQK